MAGIGALQNALQLSDITSGKEYNITSPMRMKTKQNAPFSIDFGGFGEVNLIAEFSYAFYLSKSSYSSSS